MSSICDFVWNKLMDVAEVYPPGEFLLDELEARNWSKAKLAGIIDCSVQFIDEIIAGKKTIGPETAVQLGDTLGTGPELWMNLESQFQLSRHEKVLSDE